MGKAGPLVLAALGAASIAYGACELNSRYSKESIFGRQQVVIEHVYRAESPARPDGAKGASGAGEPAKAESNKARRLQDLAIGLHSLGDAPIQERCEFEAQFERQSLAGLAGALELGTPIPAVGLTRASTPPEGGQSPQSPVPHCSMENILKDTTTEVTLLAGLTAFLAGIFGLMKRRSSMLGKEADGRRKAMENERKDALLQYGIPPAFAYTITTESLRAQSAYELHTCVHTSISLLHALRDYGFSKSDIQRILLCFPPLLNMTPEALGSRLSELEENGARTQQEVLAAVVKLPGVLGR